MSDQPVVWPSLPSVSEWEGTYATLHMWLQIAGKIRLQLSPWINHSWGSALYLTPRGLTTSPLHQGDRTFAIDFDFIEHTLRIPTSHGPERQFPLTAMPVAQFYEQTLAALRDLGIGVKIFKRPVEVLEAIPFDRDRTHASYDGAAVQRVFRAVLQAERVLSRFRARFIGKASPVHVFWGAFDLAATRFSGRPAPRHPGGAPHCADWVMVEAYSHELSSAGFWPGMGLGAPAFYSYAYPQPSGFAEAAIEPREAYYHGTLGEFILPYEAVRTARDPDQALWSFLQSTYEAAAQLGGWDRAALEREPPGAAALAG
ncbi:MAG TPA: DUF5996 family protein [Polyangiaceae bacterium]|nr:DUF5996 family protein [Polyangiaceae bacterium]